MGTRKHRIPAFLMLLAALVVFMAATPKSVYGDGPRQGDGQGSCVKCHENLYFLHDTGKWFCLREAPMNCVDCHGGDPTSLIKEQSHSDRSAHPVFNDDSTKCLECHPAQRAERLRIFRETAGIKKVIVQADYVPVAFQPLVGSAAEQAEPVEGPPWKQAIMWLLGAGLVLTLIAGYKRANRARQ